LNQSLERDQRFSFQFPQEVRPDILEIRLTAIGGRKNERSYRGNQKETVSEIL